MFGMQKISACQAQKIMRHAYIYGSKIFQSMTPHRAHVGLHDCLGSETMARAILKSKNIARQVKCANLATPICETFVASDGTADDLIDAISGLALPKNLLVFSKEILRTRQIWGEMQ